MFASVLSEGYVRYMDIAERKRAEEALVKQTAQLSETNESLEEKERMLTAFDQIGLVTLSSLDLEQVLDNLAKQIVDAGIFRSLMIALVDEQTRSVEVVQNLFRDADGTMARRLDEVIGIRYDLDEDNITAEVARTGKMQVIVEWDARFDKSVSKPEDYGGQVAYFIPVKQGDRVLAVLATASRIEEKEERLHRIEVMRPLLNGVAIALEHARLYRALQESEEHFRDLYGNAPNIYFSVGVDGHIRGCNRRAGELLGYVVDDLVGRPIFELYANTTT